MLLSLWILLDLGNASQVMVVVLGFTALVFAGLIYIWFEAKKEVWCPTPLVCRTAVASVAANTLATKTTPPHAACHQQCCVQLCCFDAV